MIDFFSNDDLQKIIDLLQQEQTKKSEVDVSTENEPRSVPVSSFMSGITNMEETPKKEEVQEETAINRIEEVVEEALEEVAEEVAEAAEEVAEERAEEKSGSYFPGPESNMEESPVSAPSYGGENRDYSAPNYSNNDENKGQGGNSYPVSDFTI